jgi:hypothetical protein
MTLKEHDSVRIDPRKNCFWRNSTEAKGSIIDFAIEFDTAFNASEALSILKARYNIKNDIGDLGANAKNAKKDHIPTPASVAPALDEPKGDITLPAKADGNKAVYMYLVHQRGIDIEVFKHYEKRGYIYQDEKRNCVFVGFDKDNRTKPVFASLRGTGEKRFMQDLPNCDYDQCIVLRSDSKAKVTIVTESTIDALSYATNLKKRGVNFKELDFLVLSGVNKTKALHTHLQNNPQITNVVLALDNDEAGRNAAMRTKQEMMESNKNIKVAFDIPKTGKDWNEVICANIKDPPDKQSKNLEASDENTTTTESKKTDIAKKVYSPESLAMLSLVVEKWSAKSEIMYNAASELRFGTPERKLAEKKAEIYEKNSDMLSDSLKNYENGKSSEKDERIIQLAMTGFQVDYAALNYDNPKDIFDFLDSAHELDKIPIERQAAVLNPHREDKTQSANQWDSIVNKMSESAKPLNMGTGMKINEAQYGKTGTDDAR